MKVNNRPHLQGVLRGIKTHTDVLTPAKGGATIMGIFQVRNSQLATWSSLSEHKWLLRARDSGLHTS